MPRKTTRPTYYRDRECPTCHCFFTPQGLAGHLRFAHKNSYGERDVIEVLGDFETKKSHVKAYCSGAQLPDHDRDQALRWLDEWERVLMYGDMLGVRFTQQDFKHYLVARIVEQR